MGSDQRLEARGIASQHRRNQLRIGPFHPAQYANPPPESQKPRLRRVSAWAA
jgi:hypothetical protein